MNAALRVILRMAERLESEAPALVHRRGELRGEIAALEILLHAAEARSGRQPARPPTPENGRMGPQQRPTAFDFDGDLAERIEERLRLNQPQSDGVLAEDLGVADRAVSAACKRNADRFRRVAVRGGQNVWGLVQEE